MAIAHALAIAAILSYHHRRENTMDKFTLTIELGNDAMQTPDDVASALIHLTEDLESATGGDVWHIDAGILRDVNGNTIGRWSAD